MNENKMGFLVFPDHIFHKSKCLNIIIKNKNKTMAKRSPGVHALYCFKYKNIK